MRSTVKKLSAMILAVLMVATMASLLAVSAELKYGARTLGSIESLTLGDSSNYATLGTSDDGVYFADSIGVWGWNGITSYAPLSNQNGIDIFVETYNEDKLVKNIYIDLSAWSNPTDSAKWAKYGTKTITIGFNAKKGVGGVTEWAAMPTSGVTNVLQFFTFKVDDVGQIQLFDTDTVADIANGGDNGVWNVRFEECVKQTVDDQESTNTEQFGYVENWDAEDTLWLDLFHGTHNFTKLLDYDFGVVGQINYNSKDTNAVVNFLLSSGTLTKTEWDIVEGEYVTTTTSVAGTSLDLDLLKLALSGTPGLADYALDGWEAFYDMTYDDYNFEVDIADPRIGSNLVVPTDARVYYDFNDLEGNLRITWTTANAVTGLQTAYASGGEDDGEYDCRLVANQTQTLTAGELEAGKYLMWEYVDFDSDYQPFGRTYPYPLNQNYYTGIIYETSRGAQSDWNFDNKIQALAADMNLVDASTLGKVDLQLVPTAGGDDLIAGLAETDEKGRNLRYFGHTVNYYVDYTNDFMCQMTIDIHNNTLDGLTTEYGKANLVVKITEGLIVSAYSQQITQYDETFVVPLQDGTFTLLRIKVKTNYDDKAGPLADADFTDFSYSRLTFVEQIKLYNDRLVNANGTRVYNSNANKVIYVDMINAIPGSGSAYWAYNTATPPVGTFRADGYNGISYYTKLTALLSYVGFNVDGSKPVRNPVGYSKFFNGTADSIEKTEAAYNAAGYDGADGKLEVGLSLTPAQIWDTSFRLVYEKGTGDAKESISLVIYPLTPAQTLNYEAADGNTYVYSLFFHTKYGEMPVAAASLGVGQKTDVKMTKAGMYTYAIGSSTTDTGKGFGVGTCTKTETKGTITITNYWDNTRGLFNEASNLANYNKAITVLSVRIPAGATLTTSDPGNGVEARVVGLEYGKLGLNTVDGLVDAYVAIEYSTVSDTKFTLSVNYNDGPNDGVKGYTGFTRTWDVVTTWVVRTDANPDTTHAASKAYNAFTSTLGKTLTPAPAVMPSNPAEAQSVQSVAPTSSVTSTPADTSTPDMGNPFNAIAYIITIGASAIGGISTLVIRKRK